MKPEEASLKIEYPNYFRTSSRNQLLQESESISSKSTQK